MSILNVLTCEHIMIIYQCSLAQAQVGFQGMEQTRDSKNSAWDLRPRAGVSLRYGAMGVTRASSKPEVTTSVNVTFLHEM